MFGLSDKWIEVGLDHSLIVGSNQTILDFCDLSFKKIIWLAFIDDFCFP